MLSVVPKTASNVSFHRLFASQSGCLVSNCWESVDNVRFLVLSGVLDTVK